MANSSALNPARTTACMRMLTIKRQNDMWPDVLSYKIQKNILVWLECPLTGGP